MSVYPSHTDLYYSRQNLKDGNIRSKISIDWGIQQGA